MGIQWIYSAADINLYTVYYFYEFVRQQISSVNIQASDHCSSKGYLSCLKLSTKSSASCVSLLLLSSAIRRLIQVQQNSKLHDPPNAVTSYTKMYSKCDLTNLAAKDYLRTWDIKQWHDINIMLYQFMHSYGTINCEL